MSGGMNVQESLVQNPLLTRVSACRVCKGKNLQTVLSLGTTPPANAFLKPDQLSAKEHVFPLDLYFCKDCSFIQLADVVSPELLFRDYVYVSSTSPVFVKHFELLADQVCTRFALPQNALVVDIGSNDGILLRPFKHKGMRVLGVDPAVKIAQMATKNGIETIPAFFTPEIAQEMVKKHGPAKLITATSVFPHVHDLDSLVTAVKELLAPDGIFMIEAYYLVDFLEKNLFDTVYHEHLSYFSVKTITDLLERLGMRVFDVEKTDTHGGSIRVFAQKAGGPYPIQYSIHRFLMDEAQRNLDKIITYTTFAQKIETNKNQLIKLLQELKAQGKRIVGYGAAAKANTLLNYFGIDTRILDCIIDDSPWKQGLYTPGTHIPVVSADAMTRNPPDYVLILAWNFARPIMNKYADQSKFIVPVPKPLIINDLVDQDLYMILDGLGNDVFALEGKTVLITGGSGFLGSYMVAFMQFLNRTIFERPCKVVSMDNHIVGQRKNNLVREITDPNISFLEHNVCLPFDIDQPVDYVISAAGVASPPYYKKFPIETIEGTIFGIKNVLDLARAKKAKSVLYFSSSEIYGDPDPNFIPTPETYKGNVSCTGPRSCYDESKRLGETLCLAYHQVHGVPIKIVRPFNVYGPGMSATDYRVVPKFLSQGLKGDLLTVHGKGNQTRTFCYVTDAVIGFFKVLLSQKSGEIYNVGNDNDELNMKVLADTIAEALFDNRVKVRLIEYPQNYPQDEPTRRCPDLAKVKRDLDYKPSIDIKTGLKRTHWWLKEHTNR